MIRQLTIDRIKSNLIKSGADLIEIFREDQRTKVSFICRCGKQRRGFLCSNLISKSTEALCEPCSLGKQLGNLKFRKKYSLEFIKERLRVDGAILVKRFSENENTYVSFICKCGLVRGKQEWSTIFNCGCRALCEACVLELNSGSNSKHWNSDLTENQRNTQYGGRSPKYKEWSKTILRKANYTCQLCGKKGGKLSAHHLYNWADYPDKRFDLSNGVAICRGHHIEFHRIYGKGNNTPEQFSEFTSNFRKVA
ncbi:MAG TPA: hypothetical protein ENI23_16885 [bacterium]|nr:hypothetical protein [bacterium]